MKIMSRYILLQFVLIFLSVARLGAAEAIEEYCSGGIKQEHNPSQNYQFRTFSRTIDNGDFSIGLMCVQNIREEDISIDWFIPNLSGWIPGKEILFKERVIRSTPAVGVESCVEYGNLGEWTKANFFGDEIDSVESEKERNIGCVAARDRYHTLETKQDLSPKLADIKINIISFFPSSNEIPYDTMLKLNGFVTVELINDELQRISMNFRIEQYPGREKGIPDQVYVVPVINREASVEVKIAESIGEREIITGFSEKVIEVNYNSGDGRIEEMTFEFQSESGDVLGKISFPVYGV